MNSASPRLRAAWMAVIALAVAAIVAGSLVPSPPIPGSPGFDKLGHALSYAALTVLGGGIVAPGRLWLVPLRCLLLGLLMEAAQGLLTEGREADWADAAANAAGVLAGWAAVRGPRCGWARHVDAWLRRRRGP